MNESVKNANAKYNVSNKHKGTTVIMPRGVYTKLRDNYLRAKDAMDEFILSQCDPDLLNQYREMRDAAKSNYETYCEKHGFEVEY